MSPRNALILAAMAALSCTPMEPAPDNAVHVGALLEFTGNLALSGTSNERALLLAAEAINQAGGISGRPLWIDALDTKNDSAHAARALDALDPRIVAVIGPSGDELTRAIGARTEERQLLYLVPSVLFADQAGAALGTLWVRTGVSCRDLARGMAKRMRRDALSALLVLRGTDAYSTAFADDVTEEFLLAGGTSVQQMAFGGALESSDADQIVALNPSGILLAANPEQGANLLNSLYLLAPGLASQWYLAPTLESNLFLTNVIPGALEGATGVRAGFDTGFTAEFADLYKNRWDGEEPPTAAGFYFDSLNLLALALGQLERDSSPVEALVPTVLRDAVVATGSPNGLRTLWQPDEMARGIENIREGRTVYYSGVSGTFVFDAERERVVGLSSFWRVRDQAIVVDDSSD